MKALARGAAEFAATAAIITIVVITVARAIGA